MIELNKIADYLMRLNCNKWGVISVILILFGAVYMGFIFPMTIKYIMKTVSKCKLFVIFETKIFFFFFFS